MSFNQMLWCDIISAPRQCFPFPKKLRKYPSRFASPYTKNPSNKRQKHTFHLFSGPARKGTMTNAAKGQQHPPSARQSPCDALASGQRYSLKNQRYCGGFSGMEPHALPVLPWCISAPAPSVPAWGPGYGGMLMDGTSGRDGRVLDASKTAQPEHAGTDAPALPASAFRSGRGMPPRHGAAGAPSDGTGGQQAPLAQGTAPASLLHHLPLTQKRPKCHNAVVGPARGHQGVNAPPRTRPRLEQPALIRLSKIIIPMLRASGDTDVPSTKRSAVASPDGVGPAGLRLARQPPRPGR